MSSKLNVGHQPKSNIPWCLPPPDVPIPIIILPPGALPPSTSAYLVAYAKWFDWEPDTFLSESFRIHHVGAGDRWEGQSSHAYPYLTAAVWWDMPPGYWNLTLGVYRAADDFETHTWWTIAATRADPLTIEPPPVIVIPDQDEQHLAVYG